MKHKFLWRALAFLIALSLFALPSAALAPAYTVSGAYKGSTYHNNLLALPLTGDKAFDAVAIALSQLDYREGNSTADFGGEREGGSKNFTEFNRFLGKISGSYSYAWCAAFVSWCLRQAGAGDSAGGSFASCTLWVERLRELGQYATRASGYTPKRGDLIFFRSAGVSRASDHVGIVRYVKNGRVYTVEGNASNRVSARDYALSDTYIVGYGKPSYNASYTLPGSAVTAEDKVGGYYVVSNSFVNIRAGASASTAKQGTLQKGALLHIVSIKDGWGLFYYREKAAYISLDYADFVSPDRYTVTYDFTDSQGSPFKAYYYSVEKCYVTDSVPERENAVFIGWQDGSGALYQAGDILPAGDLSLTAVWEARIEENTPLPPDGGEGSGTIGGGGFFDTPGGLLPDSTPVTPQGGSFGASVATAVTVALGTAIAITLYIKRRRENGEE